jgi:hypothetical protein
VNQNYTFLSHSCQWWNNTIWCDKFPGISIACLNDSNALHWHHIRKQCTPKIREMHPNYCASHHISESMQCQYPASIFLMRSPTLPTQCDTIQAQCVHCISYTVSPAVSQKKVGELQSSVSPVCPNNDDLDGWECCQQKMKHKQCNDRPEFFNEFESGGSELSELRLNQLLELILSQNQ